MMERQRACEYMKRILIVEDDEAIRTELITLLRANGYLPVEAQPCELILMDINLPGESGFSPTSKTDEARQGRDGPFFRECGYLPMLATLLFLR